jgi:hypothetical protein
MGHNRKCSFLYFIILQGPILYIYCLHPAVTESHNGRLCNNYVTIKLQVVLEELIAHFPDTSRTASKTTCPTILLLCVFATAVTFLPSRCLATIGGFLLSRCLAMIGGYTD